MIVAGKRTAMPPEVVMWEWGGSEKMSVEQLKLQLRIGSTRLTDSNSVKTYKTGCLLPTDGRILLYVHF